MIKEITKIEEIVYTTDMVKEFCSVLEIGGTVTYKEEIDRIELENGKTETIYNTKKGEIISLSSRNVRVDFGKYPESVQKIDFLTGQAEYML